jgi:hypothetical protein
MTVIARDAVAADHLVYAWPFPLGPDCEVSCADDEQVVMCPAWLVGDRLGPGRHRWHSPDPSRPVAAFFVLTSAVEAPFDMVTSFVVPSSGMPVRLRATGSVQVRCADPGLLIAQFVGLPFDRVNEGILRSVARSVERMLARLLTRRVVMAGTPYAVTDPAMLGSVIEELIAYNPTAGAVFGVELLRIRQLAVAADDGSAPYLMLPQPGYDEWASQPQIAPMTPDPERGSQPSLPGGVDDISLVETVRGRPRAVAAALAAIDAATAGSIAAVPPPASPAVAAARAAPEPESRARGPSAPPATAGSAPRVGAAPGNGAAPRPGGRPASVPPPIPPLPASKVGAGEQGPRAKKATEPGMPAPPAVAALGTSPPGRRAPGPLSTGTGPLSTLTGSEAPRTAADLTQPAGGAPSADGFGVPVAATPPPHRQEGGILGIGVGAIGGSRGSVSGEIPLKIAPGQRVLVPGPNGLMQSATVRQLLQGYYELEVGSSGDTIWVPINGVVPES